MEKIWEVAPRKFDDLIFQLLYNRGVIEDEPDALSMEKFLRPDFLPNLNDPYLLSDMKEAVTRIAKAVRAGEKIGVFSDYDADGIPGAALLHKTFKALGCEPVVYIPNRECGYGLSREGIDYLQSKGCGLIITVDLGIRSLEEPRYCREKGIDLIITDHHLPGEEIPKAKCVINPKRIGDKYPYKELSGCGVAYKLVQALAQDFPDILDEKFLKWNLDLVAISTICDVVPLSGENRVLAKYGLMVLRKTKNLGLKELYKFCNIEVEKLSAYHVGFLIGPRINAPGRIDSATKSFELLVTENIDKAVELAKWLNEKNLERQAEMDEIEKESIEKIEEQKLDKNKIIILSGKWSKGVIGPTASRLVERYHRPVILFSSKESIYTGSARSVSGVNIVELIENAKELVIKYGGHKGAAGLSVVEEKFGDFVKTMINFANQNIGDESLAKKIRIDAEVKISELTFKLYENITLLEPFGLENSRPTFMASDVTFENFRFVGKNLDHFSATANDNKDKIKTIYFNFPFDKDLIAKDNKYKVAFTLNQEEWRGERKLSMNIVDLKTPSN